jgi:hypothetical protein
MPIVMTGQNSKCTIGTYNEIKGNQNIVSITYNKADIQTGNTTTTTTVDSNNNSSVTQSMGASSLVWVTIWI